MRYNNYRILIDTGASKSLINEQIYDSMKDNFGACNPFCIQTPHGIEKGTRSLKVTLPEIFKDKKEHILYCFNFSEIYDMLIGMDIIKSLKASINSQNETFQTPKVEIPYFTKLDEIKLFPNQSQIVKYKVNNMTNGYAYFPQTRVKLPNGEQAIISPAAIVKVTKGETLIRVNNITGQQLHTYGHTHRINVEPIHEIEECVNIGYNKIPKQKLQQLQQLEIEKHLSNETFLNIEEKAALKALLFKYKHIFHTEGQKLTFTHKVKHSLNMKTNDPIFVKRYRQPLEMRKEIKKQISELLNQDIIQESISPWSAPVHIVTQERDGKLKKRMVIDYRKLNEGMIEDKYPIPNISDILDKLGRSQYFTSLDLASGYHQVEMNERDAPRTAFSTEQGHFEFKRMPFGLKNAPATFQRLMDNVLKGLQEDICLVYLDDIVIYSNSLEEHLLKLTKVFDRLVEANFKLKLEKCQFLKKELKYLGHLITGDGVKPNPDKIDAIRRYPIPQTKREIKSFLGLLGYYRKFIRDFAKITKPFTKCLKKSAKVELTEEYRNAFKKCQTLLTNDPILQYPDFDKEFIITTDASDIAVGAVLSQGNIGTDKPVCYASRTLSDTETNYTTSEKELLAIVYATKQFRPYIYGRKFTICTDHKPLIWLWTLKDPNSRLMRWRIKLEEYDFNIVYKKGKINANADALSRIKLDQLNVLTEKDLDSVIVEIDDEELLRMAEEMSIRIIDPQDPQPSTSAKGKVGLGKGRKAITRNQPTNVNNEEEVSDVETNSRDNDDVSDSNTIHSTQTQEPATTIVIKDTILDNKKKQFILSYGTNTLLSVTRKREDDKFIHNVKIPKRNQHPEILKLYKEYMADNTTFYIYLEDDNLYQACCNVYSKEINDKGPRIIRCLRRAEIIKTEDRKIELISEYHHGITNHRGIEETVKHLQYKYWWPKMKNAVTKFIKACDVCNKSKYNRNPEVPPLPITKTCDAPFEKIFIDVFTVAKDKYLTIVDTFSRLGHAIKIDSKNPADVLDALITYFSYYGIPEEISSDAGTEFNNQLIKEIANLHKIKLHLGTAKNPESQANVERFHSTLLEHLRCMEEDNEIPTERRMRMAIIAYNNSISSATGITPLEAILGHTKTRNPLELYYDKRCYQDLINRHKERMKILYSRLKAKDTQRKEKTQDKQQPKVRQKEFKIGEKVYVENITKSNKMLRPFLGPFTIIKINDNDTVEVSTRRGNQTYHKRRLKHGIVPDASPSEPPSEM